MKKLDVRPYLLTLPLLLLTVIFLLGIFNGLVQSFGIIPALGLYEPTLKYYVEIFQRSDLLSSITFSLYTTLVSSVGAAVLGVALCALLVMSGKAKGKTLQMIKIPIVIPHTVVALFVINIFAQRGLLARVLYAVGLLESQQAFPGLLFADNGIGIILAYLWKEIPFVAFFVVSIMGGINSSLGEAAENLGASRLKTFFCITLPLCMPSIKNAFLIVFAFTLGAYELPFLLGATVPKALPVQAYIEYMHPDLLHRPYAMALNGIMFFISLILIFLYYRLIRQNARKW